MVSARYVELATEEEIRSALHLLSAWKDPRLPERQWAIVKPELEATRRGRVPATYRVFADLARRAGVGTAPPGPSLLDIGAGVGHYREILAIAGLVCRYKGIDYSPAFRDYAANLWPGIDYEVADAIALPYADSSFDVVLSGGCLLHIPEWRKAVIEAARVSKEWIIFHRTPFYHKKKTTFFTKEAYDVPCIEIHFNEAELVAVFRSAGLRLAHVEGIFVDQEGGHRSYLCRKG